MKRALAVALALTGASAPGYVPWEELTEADWLYEVVTRHALVDGRKVHYPTPTAELAAALRARSETAALRHLAEARLELGDRAGAVEALERWAGAEGPAAWDEAARWAAAHGDWPLAFRAAAKALGGLAGDARRSLAGERVRWADGHPEAADSLAMRKERAEMFPEETAVVEDWIRALERAGRLEEAETGLAAATGLARERKLLLRSDLRADHGDHRRAFEILDAALEVPPAWGPEVKRAYAQRVARASPGSPEAWRAALEKAFDPRALLRLATYFQGQERGDAALALLLQVERRYEAGLDRKGFLLLARLAGEIDAVAEAFRATLSAAHPASAEEQLSDLAALAQLALRAGGRPLPWGTYNEEPYRWVARIDRTPGFWTGGLSFLLTGQDWKEALARLESDSVPERTFAAARSLTTELARRAPDHASLPLLRLGLMTRHVERGDGREALALLPLLQAGAPEVAREAQRVALLAARQVPLPLTEELRLHQARLRALAPDGSRPSLAREEYSSGLVPWEDSASPSAWTRVLPTAPVERYARVLDEAVARLEQLDRSHQSALGLILGEMDRMPEAEELWLDLAGRLESWSLDDELGPRYERALERFRDPGWWTRLARWYARRSRERDLQRLAGELVARFRGSEIFARAEGGPRLTIAADSQPAVGERLRLVEWADWVRLQALQRFPHSPTVFREARGRLLARSAWERDGRRPDRAETQRVVVPDALLEERSSALLFVDPERREEYFAGKMKDGGLEELLVGLEGQQARTPVHDLLLFEGWSRLSRFERAVAAADRLCAAYPGNGELARRALSLRRSLAALDPSQAGPAAALVERTAPALADPSPLWTALGELEQESGRPESAKSAWQHLLARDPRDPGRISELATVLWDYGHMAEALGVIEEGRKQLDRPRLLAFEAGVLREELRNVDAAVREYLAALQPESGDCFCWFEQEQRSLRRLSQLLARERVRSVVRKRLDGLRPGVRADEQVLAALLPLAQVAPPDDTLDWTTDDWIDQMDLPRDPVGRAEREERRAAWRPEARAGTLEMGQALLDRALEFVPRASDASFLDALEKWSAPLVAGREDSEVAFRAALLARRAELAPTEEERITREAARARYLFDHGRRSEADAVWSALSGRIGALPEGAPRMRAEADRASYLERTRGADDAAAEWSRLATRYPWSLGMLEDRLAFLARNQRGAEGRKLLEAAISRAAAGHREALLERLTREALEAGDLAQAERAVDRLIAEPSLPPAQRLGAAHLRARLSFRQDSRFEALALAQQEAPKLPQEQEPDVYVQLARAADAERAFAAGVGLWIEALNRRLDRVWLREAAAGAERAGKGSDLLAFFEKQQARSPRDVRWAVAVRELRLAMGDIEGAITMAKTAVTVRPDRESLWREAALLLVRAGRTREAADFLEGWQSLRPADENAVRERGRLYARVGAGEKVLALERAALLAFSREADMDEARARELVERRGRATRRLRELGLPGEAWRLLAGDNPYSIVLAHGLSASEEADLALSTGNFMRLLRRRAGDEVYRIAAAEVLRARGRPEQKEEVQNRILDQLFPPRPSGGRAPVNPQELDRLWPFVEAAGLETSMRHALAQVSLAATPGPWQAGAPTTFVQAVAEGIVTRGAKESVFRVPPLDGLWAHDLVLRDQPEALFAFLEPRWDELVTQVRSTPPLPGGPGRVERVAWATWLDDPEALAVWARGAASKPERVAEIAGLLSEPREWSRFNALAAGSWSLEPLVALLPEDVRPAWFRPWLSPTSLRDPSARVRAEAVERVTAALGRLVAGAGGASSDPLVAKLRGPRTVGDVLGNDPSWVWTEWGPQRTARGPGDLWGERPGVAWFALEALARLRERDPAAALVPMEAMARGREGERTLLAVRLAEHLGDPALALELDEAFPSADLSRLAVRLRLVGSERANVALEAEVKRTQPALTEAAFRRLRRLASDLDLPDPKEMLDPAVPLPPVFLAYLWDRVGPTMASRFQSRDPVEFRAALANRWGPRRDALGAEEIRFYLSELWVHDAAPLPERGLRRLGGLWPHVGAWLNRLRPGDRGAGLAAVAALPDVERLQVLLAREPEPKSDAVRLLRLRVHLLREEDERAVALLDEMRSEGGTEGPLLYQPAPVEAPSEEEGEYSEAAPAEVPPAEDPATARWEAWLAPFKEAKRLDLVAERCRAALGERRAKGAVPPAAWRLALELAASDEEQAGLGVELERAWVRGDWSPEELGPLVEALARVSPIHARSFLERWPAAYDYDTTARRARVLAVLKDAEGSARTLVEGRRRGAWTAEEEVKAFDAWRAVATDAKNDAPAAWTAARAFWRKRAPEVGPDLAEHLRAHAHDIRAARAALRTVAPGDEEAMRLADLVLGWAVWPGSDATYRDSAFLRLRIARGLSSWRAALRALEPFDATGLEPELRRRRLPAADVTAAVADAARLAARRPRAGWLEPLLAALEDRRPEEAKTARAELQEIEKPEAPRPYRMAGNQPAPYLPRDLDFPVVAAALAAEAGR